MNTEQASNIRIEMSKIQKTQGTNDVDEEDLEALGIQLEKKSLQVFPDLKIVENPSNFSGQADLEITPLLKKFRLIGGVTRFFGGALTGPSGIQVQLEYWDVKETEFIGTSEYSRFAVAYEIAWIIGRADNRILDAIADEIANQTAKSR